MNKNNKKGFTLIEIIVVLVILSVLAGAAIPTMLGFILKTDEAVCVSNRGAIKRFSVAHSISDPSCDLEDIIEGRCDVLSEDIKSLSCPSGGDFSVLGAKIICSKHGDGSGGSGGGGSSSAPANKYPGTDVEIVPSYWPKGSDFPDPYGTLLVPAGGIFMHSDGNYYVVTKSVAVTKGQAAGGPGGEVVGWYNTQKITGKIVEFLPGDIFKTVTRGDICKVGSDYYVFKDGGTYGNPPGSVNGLPQWYKLP